MKITFLGTGTSQGIPVIGCNCRICKSKAKKDNRLRSSIHIQYNNSNEFAAAANVDRLAPPAPF